MFNRIFWSLSIVLLSLASGCNQPGKNEEEVQEKRPEPKAMKSDLPEMPVQLVDGGTISLREINHKMVLILFQPDCEDCQREARSIRKNIDAFAGYELYFVSSHPVDIIRGFADSYDLSSQPNVHFGGTTVENVLNNFGAIAAPSVYIYDENGKLKTKFNGEVQIDLITSAL